MTYLQDISMITIAFVFGGMVFFSFVMAPLIFIKLEGQIAAHFIRQVFPVYYIVMAISCFAISLLTFSIHLYVSLATLILALIFIWLRFYLVPTVNKYRDLQKEGDNDAGKKFDFLHRLSVIINFIQIVTIATVFFVVLYTK
ncbi:DUF4149 domain-containing protein [Candidatus Uabimicrobium amorphum]|uniref:TMEM205-like domain-containing protein n=1 Tax=Uabimicrobium amorphum TaxID=2596890 RepID=A0A5S9F5U6_UABAM|nr:DUF4149 domain-containing protein [Candidatus Uabimicrobium amorphum]BBM85924.1 hypothetical protein UABAM_04310 [Candidatus Uabimicrobium amorphum]